MIHITCCSKRWKNVNRIRKKNIEDERCTKWFFFLKKKGTNEYKQVILIHVRSEWIIDTEDG
jgi:hypothetical protein